MLGRRCQTHDFGLKPFVIFREKHWQGPRAGLDQRITPDFISFGEIRQDIWHDPRFIAGMTDPHANTPDLRADMRDHRPNTIIA